MNSSDRLFKVLSGEKADRVPVLSVTQTGTVELMASTDSAWPESNSNTEKMVKLAVAGHTQAGLEAIRLPFCLTVLAEALGCSVDAGRNDRQPSVTKTMLENGVTPDIDTFLNKGRIPVVLQAIRDIKAMNYNVPIVVGFEGPVTLTGHMVGVEKLCLMIIRKPEEALGHIRKAEEACVAYSKAVLNAGADVIAPADPTASPSILSPRMFDKFAKASLKSISAIHKMSILHICGNATPIINHMADCGFAGLSLEEKVDLKQAKTLIGDRKVAIVGNVPSAGVLLNGSDDDVFREAKNAINAGVDVLAPSCGIAPRTPTRNLKAMVRAANTP